MKVFLTGATGYIGSAILAALVDAGHDVTALVRDSAKGTRVSAAGAKAVVGNLGTPDSFASAAAGHDAYVLAGFEGGALGPEVDRLSIGALLDVAQSGSAPTAVVYTSGVWVLGSTQKPAAEDAALNPAPSVLWRPAHERLVLEAAQTRVRTAVVRPGIVYGGARGLVGDMFKDADNGLIRVVGDGRNHWPLIYNRDLGQLYRLIVESPEAAGVFHANDEGDETVLELVEAMSQQTAHEPSVRHLPVEEATKKMGAYAAALAMDQIVRSPKAKALGWQPSLRSVAGNVSRLFEEWRAGRDE
jgi:nucleoside-diphosphate-sugar epimerase